MSALGPEMPSSKSTHQSRLLLSTLCLPFGGRNRQPGVSISRSLAFYFISWWQTRTGEEALSSQTYNSNRF